MAVALTPVELAVGDVGALGSITLRPWRSGDRDEVLQAWTDPDIARWTTQLPAPQSRHVESWLTTRTRGWNDGTMATWAVVGGQQTLLGSVGLKRLDLARLHPPPVHAEIMYWVVPAGRGHGLATVLAAFVGRWAGTALGLHRVELRHETDNIGSCRVGTAAGYALEGATRRSYATPHGWADEHLHALLLDTTADLQSR